MKYEFHPGGHIEFRESAAFYESCRPALGSAFPKEVESIWNLIVENPKRWPRIAKDVRRCLARRFPYAVLYSIESGYVLILAAMHCSRKPGYWRDRLSEHHP